MTARRLQSPETARGDQATGDRWLDRAALFFAIAVIVHNGDHLRRGGDALDIDVFWIGGLGGIALEVGLVVLICQRHRLAPLAAAVVGAGLAVAYLKVHFLPDHAWLSDSFVSTSADPLSWIAASLEVAAAITIAVVGTAVLQRRGGLAAASRTRETTRRTRDAISHPLALVMILSQALTLTAFVLQRYG